MSGDADGINEQLGYEEGELPFAKRDEGAVRILRIHAKELKGKIEDAGKELLWRIEQIGVTKLEGEIQRHLPLAVCMSSMNWATAYLRAVEEENAVREKAEAVKTREIELQLLRKELAALPVIDGTLVIGTAVFAVVIAFGLSWILIAVAVVAGIDPVFGIAGRIACAGACEGCASPLRTVSWTATTNNSDEMTTTLILCDDENYTIGSLSPSDLKTKAVYNDPLLKRFTISDWSLMRIAMLFYSPFIFALILFKTVRFRKLKRSEIERRMAKIDTSGPETMQS